MNDNINIDKNFISDQNKLYKQQVINDFENCSSIFFKSNSINIEKIFEKLNNLNIVLPSWGFGVGGTRFAKFPIMGEPTNVFEKIQDCSIVSNLLGNGSKISLHFPWDKVRDINELLDFAKNYNITFDAVNSNTFQDNLNQEYSYKFGSLSSIEKNVREQAVEHNIECINIGNKIGSKSITIWISDGSNFPGQINLQRGLENYLSSLTKIYERLPENWTLFLEHKHYEPAFYSTILSDWGTSLGIANLLGEKAKCLVDLGHHAPTTNIENVVGRLNFFGKLGGFHFNDSKYGDDDLDTGSIDPFRLFLIWHELYDCTDQFSKLSKFSYMIDQSHNVTDPIESFILSIQEIQKAFIKSLLINYEKLKFFQNNNDVIMSRKILKQAYELPADIILNYYNINSNYSVFPIEAYRKLDYRNLRSKNRKLQSNNPGII